MLLSFVIILMGIGLQVFKGVQKDKEDTYLTMAQMLDNYSITPNNYVFMLNSDGMLAAHPDEDVVLLQNWLTGECDSPVSSENIDAMTENLKTVAVNMTKGAGGIVSRYDYIYAYEPIGIGGMSVCVAAPFDEAFGIIKNLFVMLCAAMVITVAIGIFMAVIMANGIGAPFAWIVKQTQALSRSETKMLDQKPGGYAATKEMAELCEKTWLFYAVYRTWFRGSKIRRFFSVL